MDLLKQDACYVCWPLLVGQHALRQGGWTSPMRKCKQHCQMKPVQSFATNFGNGYAVHSAVFICALLKISDNPCLPNMQTGSCSLSVV